MAKILETHEVLPEYLEKDISDFDILTFDDGLYSQYPVFEHFKRYDKPVYFFISPKIVCGGEQSAEIVHCAFAHDLYFSTKSTKHYMTWDQIKDLRNRGAIIGGHCTEHADYSSMSVRNQIRKAQEDVTEMLDLFSSQGIDIRSFCYPYNYECVWLKLNLKRFGITDIFGPGRIPIETL